MIRDGNWLEWVREGVLSELSEIDQELIETNASILCRVGDVEELRDHRDRLLQIAWRMEDLYDRAGALVIGQ